MHVEQIKTTVIILPFFEGSGLAFSLETSSSAHK